MSENTAVVTKKEPGMASLVIVLFAISAITALVLGLVNMVTAPQIAINTQKKTDEAKARTVHRQVWYAGRHQGRRRDRGSHRRHHHLPRGHQRR